MIYNVAPANKAGVNTANTVMWQLKGSAARRPRLLELGVFVAVAPTAAPSFALARATAIGTSTASLAGVPEDPADTIASTTVLDTAWSAAPTFTTAGPFIRNTGLPITAGSGVIWTFPRGLVIPMSGGLVIANLLATGATLGLFGMYANFEE
jgi:hypothetical protein